MSRPFTRSQAKRPLSPTASTAAPSALAQRARVEGEHSPAVASNSSHQQQPAAAVCTPVSIAQRCHTDALHCILEYLPLRDVTLVVRSCRAWQAAAMKEKPRQCWLDCDDIGDATLGSMLVSPLLQRHVTDLNVPHVVEPAELLHLNRMPLLKGLSCTVRADALEEMLQPQHVQIIKAAFEATAFAHPALATLHLDTRPECSAAAWESLLRALTSGAANLTSLSLPRPGPPLGIDLSPLLRLTRLAEFHPGGKYTLEVCRTLKQMPSLRNIIARQIMDENCLQVLCAPPHQLLLLEDVDVELDDDMLQLMVGFPNLKHLNVECNDLSPFELLANFKNLQVLDLRMFDDLEPEHMERLLGALRQCSRVTNLDVALDLRASADAGTSVLSSILRALPPPRFLCVYDFSASNSLAYLEHAPRLRVLMLQYKTATFADNEFQHLGEWTPKLQELMITSDHVLSADVRAALIPPSRLLPHLRYCSFSHYVEGAEEQAPDSDHGDQEYSSDDSSDDE